MTPLVDLHRHLEGSIRPATALEFADRLGAATRREALVAAGHEGGLLPYLAKIETASALARTLDDWHRITAEAIADAHDDGLAAVELRFAPEFIAGVAGVDADDVIDAVSDAAATAGLPVDVDLIGIIVRDQGPDSALVQARRLLRHADVLAGADLAGDEAGYPVTLFAPAFRMVRDAGIPVTIHAGEAAGPRSVWDALSLGPKRIGHGVRGAEDPRLLEHLAASGVTLEVAVTSNVQTGAARSRESHQLAALVKAGVRVALCTDNPSVSDTRLSREYEVAASLVDEASLDLIRRHAAEARFGAAR
ncbi:MAG: adenosine deaminase family protein [Streptosporangiales bacterium]|nr:adenosine deaminase family protein [Streptosporangiales bacterium]